MINWLHSLSHRPDSGWDPIAPSGAAKYAKVAGDLFDVALVPYLDAKLGGLSGKQVLDLGGGPGHYTVALARAGAHVTWHDVSRAYRDVASRRASAAGVRVEFSLGYLEEARRFASSPFDLVFNRVCWCYSMSDRHFARVIYDIVRPGGAAYIDTPTGEYADARRAKPIVYWLNDALWLKVGHPYPPRGRILSLFAKLPYERLEADSSRADRDVLFFVKPVDPPKGDGARAER